MNDASARKAAKSKEQLGDQATDEAAPALDTAALKAELLRLEQEISTLSGVPDALSRKAALISSIDSQQGACDRAVQARNYAEAQLSELKAFPKIAAPHRELLRLGMSRLEAAVNDQTGYYASLVRHQEVIDAIDWFNETVDDKVKTTRERITAHDARVRRAEDALAPLRSELKVIANAEAKYRERFRPIGHHNEFSTPLPFAI